MLAAKHFDPVVGVDIHIIQPPGPVPPVPIPHPFVGFVADPADYVPVIGSTVMINGMHRAQAGTAVVCTPPHIPIGGVFVPPPPGNDGEVFMGSATVLIDGEAQSYMSLPVLTCQSVGMPSIPRMSPKKKTIPKSLLLPTSMVLPIPAGPPVMIGGPPTISMMAMGMKAAMGALGKGFKRLRKLQKGSKKVKAFSDKAHAAAKKAMNKLGVPPNAQNKVHRSLCSVTGHPVDIATGKVFTDAVDFELPGPLPLKWERVYFTTSTYQGPLGVGWHHSYDLALLRDGDAVAVRLSDGRSVAFPALRVGDSFFDRQERLTLRRDDDGYLVQDRDGISWRFARVTFDTDVQLLVSVGDRAGQQIEFRYDKYGHLEQIQDSAGRRLPVRTDSQGRILEIRGPHPDQPQQTISLVAYEYDNEGRMTSVLDALSQAMTFRYRGSLLVQETDRNGLSFYFEYEGTDEGARCVHTWGDGGIYNHRLDYDQVLKQTLVTNSLGHSTLHCWNDQGLVVRTVDPLDCVRETVFNEFNELIAEIDELGQTTSYEYDDRGNQILMALPDEAKVEFVYNELDLPVRATDANGKFWFWNYNAAGQLISRRDPTGRETRFEYSGTLLSAIIDPAGSTTQISHDQFGNLESVTLPNAAQSRWEYDQMGRPVSVIDPRGNVQQRQYDTLGNVVRVVEPDGNLRTLRYDAMGNVVYFKDLQHEVRFTYQGMGRMASRREAGTTVTFKYNTEEDLVAITNEHGHVYRFELDERSNVAREFGFDGIRRIYTRDAAGRVVRTERASGLFTTYDYDPADRVMAVRHSDGSEETFEWRKDGQLIEAINESCTVRFERDEVGRILKEYQDDFWVSSEYNAQGLRVSMRSSLGAFQTIERDAMGDVVRMQYRDELSDPSAVVWETQIRRDQMGLELERTLPGGIRSRWQRDKLGRPLQHQVVGGGTGDGGQGRDVRYEWGVSNRLHRIMDGHRGTTTFEHDAVGNLASATYGDGTVDLRMPDAVGNLFRTRDRSDRKYGPAGQLLEATTGNETVRYKYDADGNLIRRTTPEGEWQYQWSSTGLLSSVVSPSGKTTKFEYDALARRTCKARNNERVTWIWNGSAPFHEFTETSAASTDPVTADNYQEMMAPAEQGEFLTGESTCAMPSFHAQNPEPITWLFDPGSYCPCARITSSAVHSVVTDHQGASTALTDDAGNISWIARLSSYGDAASDGDERTLCPFRWQGQYYDEETGLCYSRYRYYDPRTGIFISPDPVGLLGGTGVFSYVSDPNIQVDPLGLTAYDGPIYRGMEVDDAGKPIVYSGPSENGKNAANSLGVRPDEAAMSGATAPEKLPSHRRPAEFGGSQKNSKVFEIDSKVLKEHGLVAINDHGNHISIKPANPAMTRPDFEEALAKTRDKWKPVNAKPCG